MFLSFIPPIAISIFLIALIAAYAFYSAYTRRMREGKATLPAKFSLQNSEFGGFLYAPIGEEENGMVLTTLSALARIGVDPWQEAARLTQLPSEIASRNLVSIITELQNGRWAGSDAVTIAARLMALLPTAKASQAH